jgi:phage repressor protein C with HTH and peptisase S24 domain
MPLKHADIWRAIDRLAERHQLSPSGLAIKAGLSPTVFNLSKRLSRDRKRWPSTESIAQILQATGADLDEFVALAAPESAPAQVTLPLLDFRQAGRKTAFDEAGNPSGKNWDTIRFPALNDTRAFVLEIGGKSLEPIYRNGDRIVISPTEKPRRGDRVAVRTTANKIIIAQLTRESAQKIELLPFPAPRKPITLPRRDVEWIYRILWASQ